MSVIVNFIVLLSAVAVIGRNPPPCSSKIYCHGKLLHTVQMASIFPDSKTFVDMKMKMSEEETLDMFEGMMRRTGDQPSDVDVLDFVQEAFDPAGSEFQPWAPSDWVRSPKFLERIWDPELKSWASDLNDLWKFLGRKMTDDVRDNPERYSIYYVPNPVIVPGGRFREFYYWDSYWIVKGLLLSEMFSTVKGMLSNFMSVVENVGFIPNGGRIYYSMRSQPPLFIPMVKAYFDATHDVEFLAQSIHTLEKEFQFWMNNRTVHVQKAGKLYTLARYGDESSGPRPESYREDFLSARFLPSDEEKDFFYSQLKSAAESGWDFSSRWFIKGGTNVGNLTDTHTKQIIPVDLNAIIYMNANILSDFFRVLKMSEKSAMYQKAAEKWKDAVTKVLWHEDVGSWLDYDLLNQKRREYFYPSNLVPLWAQCYDSPEDTLPRVLHYLEELGIDQFPGGIPTSEDHTGEQWDFPNAWPPLQHMLIFGLDATDDTWAKGWAYSLAHKWVLSNYRAYNETRAMYEKYDATKFGGHGGGGEYKVQLGFGWSNGVILDLLDRYGGAISASEPLSDSNLPEVLKEFGDYSEVILISNDSSSSTPFIPSFIILILSSLIRALT